MQYVGHTKRALKTRFKEHLFKIKKRKKKTKKNTIDIFLYKYFRRLAIHYHLVKFWFSLLKNYTHVQVYRKIKNILRHELELKWIKRLQTPFLLGLMIIFTMKEIFLKCRISMFFFFFHPF